MKSALALADPQSREVLSSRITHLFVIIVLFTYVANVSKGENQLLVKFFVVVVVLGQKETQSPVP